MHRFAKSLIKNLALLVFAVGLIGAFVTYDALKEQRAANQELIKVDIENVGSSELIGKYVDIQGGIPEVRETYEYGIGDLGDGEGMLASLFYYPVVLIEGGVPQFIVVSETPPDLTADDPSSRAGLLKTQRDIPDKIMEVYAEQYPDTSLILLDTQFAPAPIAEKYINFIAFLLLIGASILGFRYAIRDEPKEG